MFLVENALKEVMEFSNNSLKKEPILKNNPRQLWKKEKVGEDGLFTLRSTQTQKYLTLSSKYSCNSTLEVFCLDGTYYLISYLLSYMSALYIIKITQKTNYQNNRYTPVLVTWSFGFGHPWWNEAGIGNIFKQIPFIFLRVDPISILLYKLFTLSNPNSDISQIWNSSFTLILNTRFSNKLVQR